jgi:hypothetical protein
LESGAEAPVWDHFIGFWDLACDKIKILSTEVMFPIKQRYLVKQMQEEEFPTVDE